jgi:ribosomal protein S1
MSEYSWPDVSPEAAARARAAWEQTVADLPAGTPVAGEVIGRQRFGVFLRLDGHPDAMGLAEITAMPRCETLPLIGDRVSGQVIWHADHNHQVKVRLDKWAQHEDLLPSFADRIGQIVTGTVTKLVPFGAFVRIADCVEGLVRPEDLAGEPVMEGQELPVAILRVDLGRRRILLAANPLTLNERANAADT